MKESMYWIIKRIKRIIIKVLARLPFSHQIYLFKRHGIKFFVYRRICQHHEKYSKKEMYDYQCRKLQTIVNHAAQNVPYYREMFKKNGLKAEDIRCPEDLVKLPTIKKDVVQKYTDLFKADHFQKYSPTEQHTSGSTGLALKFYIDSNVVSFIDAIGWRRFNWAGFNFKDTFAIIRQPIGYRTGDIDLKKQYFYDPLTRMLEINTYLLNNDEDLRKVFDLMKKFKVNVLITYPSFIHYLTGFVHRENIKIKLKSVISGAEKLYPDQRKAVKDAFQAKVYDFFGMEERVFYAAECPQGNMHGFFDSGILEIIKEGKICSQGEVGEFVCTGLHNYSMPLIRYATGDYGSILKEKCTCGSQMPLIKILGGRNRDLIVTRSSIRSVEPEHAFLKNEHEKIKEFQIYQENKDELILKIVVTDKYTEADTVYLEKRYSDLLDNEINVKVKLVDKIAREASGKFRCSLSKVYHDEVSSLV